MTRFLLASAASFFMLQLAAQPYWAREASGLGNEHIADVQVDADGAIYVTGEYGGSMQFGGQSSANAGGIDFFVARLDASGSLVWLRHGGGTGIDRGLKLALGGTNLALVGEFMGNADVLGTSLSSAGGSTDMFVALLNKADGSMLWVRQGGGSTGADRPSGVSLAADGSVCVAGEFRGSAAWEGQSLTSINDPSTGQASADVFVASYAPNGSLNWLKHGAAKFNDYAVDVVHDLLGNVFVTGQFSDTITFDVTHPNTLLNASFLLRFDAQGNESWFRRFGGAAYNHVRDLVRAPDGRLLLTGDLQGNMSWFAGSPVLVPGGAAYAYYLLASDANGQLLGQQTVGSQNSVTVRGIAASASTVAVVGAFNCQFTGLSGFYGGDGLFMATGTQDLFTALHAPSTLALTEAQQYGGRSAKSASGIGLVNGTSPVFCGSYQQTLVFPAAPGFAGDVGTAFGNLTANGVSTYCNDNNYGNFAGFLSAGLTDGFVARGHVLGRQPYDWWRRTGSGCDRSRLEPCIRQGVSATCPDTIIVCGPVSLNVNLRYAYAIGPSANYIGPPTSFLWSNGSTNSSINANTTGWYWSTITTQNGCWSWTDSVYVVVNALPPAPLVSDDVVVNTSTSSPGLITLCDPETHWVWATNIAAGATSYWTIPGGVQVQGDSVQVDTTGAYSITVVGANGCTRVVAVEVLDLPSTPMPDLVLDADIIFTQDADGNDTLLLCPNQVISFTYVPTWIINGVPVNSLPDGFQVMWNQLPAPPNILIDDGEQTDAIMPDGPGWYSAWLVIQVTNGLCAGDTLLFTVLDSIYVDFLSTQQVSVSLTGPSAVCDGDTIVLQASCIGCDSLAWSGPSTSLANDDLLHVWGPGTYIVTASVSDTSGCVFNASQSITVTTPLGPLLSISPADGIVCPGGSATMSTNSVGTDHVWYGPQGAITGMGPTLTTTTAGSYYLSMMVMGCPVVSNVATISAYGTPYLQVQPSAVLCGPGDVVSIQVMAVPSAAVQWSNPAGFTGTLLTTSEPGIYSCNVSACGIITALSVEVISAAATAQVLAPGPFTLCEGEIIVLEAAGGGTQYQWLPSGTTGPTLTVQSPGNYEVVVTNAAGCSDTSAVVVVQYILFPEPLAILGDTVCAGDAALLTATGTGGIAWYADAALAQGFASGASASFIPMQSQWVFARQEQSGCVGDTAQAFVHVKPRPGAISLSGPEFLCAGAELLITALAPDSVTIQWATPMGPLTGSFVSIAEAMPIHSGNYTAQPVYDGCTGPAASIALNVHAPAPLQLPEESVFCEGDHVVLTVPDAYTDVQWSNGATGNTLVLIASAELQVVAMDALGCRVSQAFVVEVVDCPLNIPNVFSPNGDGTNDQWLVSGGFVSAPILIYNRWGELVHEGDMKVRGWDGRHVRTGEPCSEAAYFFVLSLLRADAGQKRMSGYLHLMR